MHRGKPQPPLDPHDLYCGRIRLSRLGFWSNAASEDVEFNRLEFCISLGSYDTHISRWRMHTCMVALKDHSRRKLFRFIELYLEIVP